MEITHVASLGAGVIGASWTALFLASGRSVAVHDPAPQAEDGLRRYVEAAWPTLEELGLAARGTPDALRFCADARAAVEGANFVQESVPERLEVKHTLFAEIEPALEPGAIVASSASGLTLGQMQPGFSDPARLVLGHPFNPPHLIPLVEVMGNDATAPGVVEDALRFYEAVGKVTIRLNREAPGHVANRLQAAVWREAIHLVQQGVASVGDVDRAMWAGPGLRWALMGPTALFSLGAAGGLQAFCDHFRDTFNGWWDDMGAPVLDDETIAMLVRGAAEAAGDESHDEMAARRDAMIADLRKALRPHRG
ncbi:3-hydroxyacyl-CoA dehydrogenase [Roseovarius spongiae]|uniref:3-hydroxyacyl-CoA dehydrogenase n=1 Tax=Roseovarius spongiae TaxID=2320272 RepID=A0A3A8AYL1_9RHOB|nr:3-hydroxyacyl-CoA dehydrogenase NAD-binding domain-containing protein [Roseovarius spongiae]RKF16986.1 3-hydroxyacyl-CoA dehydrogenase [Roseovarius spongiae]